MYYSLSLFVLLVESNLCIRHPTRWSFAIVSRFHYDFQHWMFNAFSKSIHGVLGFSAVEIIPSFGGALEADWSEWQIMSGIVFLYEKSIILLAKYFFIHLNHEILCFMSWDGRYKVIWSSIWMDLLIHQYSGCSFEKVPKSALLFFCLSK